MIHSDMIKMLKGEIPLRPFSYSKKQSEAKLRSVIIIINYICLRTLI